MKPMDYELRIVGANTARKLQSLRAEILADPQLNGNQQGQLCLRLQEKFRALFAPQRGPKLTAAEKEIILGGKQ